MFRLLLPDAAYVLSRLSSCTELTQLSRTARQLTQPACSEAQIDSSLAQPGSDTSHVPHRGTAHATQLDSTEDRTTSHIQASTSYSCFHASSAHERALPSPATQPLQGPGTQGTLPMRLLQHLGPSFQSQIPSLSQPGSSLQLHSSLRSFNDVGVRSHSSWSEGMADGDPEPGGEALASHEELQQLQFKLSALATVEQLSEALDQHMHVFDKTCLQRALDVLIKSLSTARSAPLMAPTCARLGALFRHLMPNLQPAEVIDLLHSFAMLRYNPGGDEEGLKAICQHLKTKALPLFLEQDNYSALGNMVWAMASISNHNELHVDPELFTMSSLTLQKYLDSMPLSLMSKVTTAYASTGEAQHVFLERVPVALSTRLQPDSNAYQAGVRRLGTFDPGAVTNIVKALAQCKAPVPDQLLQQISTHVVSLPHGLRLHHLVNLAKSMAMMRFGSEQDPRDTESFWSTVSSCAAREKDKITPQMVQDLAYAWALRKVDDVALFKVLSWRAKTLMEGFRPVNTSIMLWAFARHGLGGEEELYKLASAHIQANLPNFSIQNIANSIWALACLDYKDPALQLAIANYLKVLLQDPEGRAQLLVDPVTGVERYVIPGKCPLVERYTENGVVLQRIEYKSGNKVVRPLGQAIPTQQFNAQNLTDLMWAFAKLGYKDKDLFSILVNRSVENVQGFTITSVVDCCWALTHAEFNHPGMFQALENHVHRTKMLTQMGLDYLSDVLYAMAVLDYQPQEEFLKDALDTAHGRWSRSGRQESTTVRLVYSFEQLGVLDSHPDHAFIAHIMDYIQLAMAQKERAEAAEAEERQHPALEGRAEENEEMLRHAGAQQ